MTAVTVYCAIGLVFAGICFEGDNRYSAVDRLILWPLVVAWLWPVVVWVIIETRRAET